MGRGEPGDGKEREIRRQSVPSLREGGWGDKLSGVRFNKERNIQHQKRPICTKLTNIYTTSSPANPQMRSNLNVRAPRAQGAFVRDGL